jgi:hypothetical protein
MSWSPDIENICEGIRQNSVIMSKEHKKRYLYLKGLLRYFKIPIIILSAVNSVISIGLQPYMIQSQISIMTCLLALSCGIVGSIELYLGIQAGMECELASSKDFYLLSVEIYKVLALTPENRSVSGISFLEEKYKEYIQLITDSNVMIKNIGDRLAPLPIGNIGSLSQSSSNTEINLV